MLIGQNKHEGIALKSIRVAHTETKYQLCCGGNYMLNDRVVGLYIFFHVKK